MHTATQLDRSLFDIQVAGESGDIGDVFPGWQLHDRFGIVVHEPFGALGASLLIQAAITAFYDAEPSRRDANSQYPEIYVFHVGGSHGDFSPFDFWPPRKEVRLTSDPLAVLEAINERAITRLAVPDGSPAPVEYAALTPSGWTESNSARERVTSVFAYSPGGRARDSDVTIAGLSADTEYNGTLTLDPDATLRAFGDLAAEELSAFGPYAESDVRGWLDVVAQRANEQSPHVRREAAERRRDIVADGVATETYRRIGIENALGNLVPRA